MKNEITSLKHQSGKLDVGSIFEGIQKFVEKIKNSVNNIKETEIEKDIGNIFLTIYNSNFQQVPEKSEERFYKKHSYAKDEWVIGIKEFIQGELLPTLQKLYESDSLSYWSNFDDFSFYEISTKFEGRKFRIIFYNSEDRLNGGKKSFTELLKENQPIRICWY
ncbi:MAG: hypothetical protein PHI37_05120 [Candidatus Gracilibacteria bacterium]|nr:hypothetical protein [Candidatus Gracilibacteria bacterium]